MFHMPVNKIKTVQCPHCLKPFTDLEDKEMRDYVTPAQYKQRLVSRKTQLRRVNELTGTARNKIFWKDHEKFPGSFDLLIAVEQIADYLRRDLNQELKREGLAAVSLDKGDFNSAQ